MDILQILEIIGCITGGGGLVGFIVGSATVRYERMKSRGEARSAENEATRAVQDVYQEMVEDVKKDREEQKAYIAELKEDRIHLRKDRDEQRAENEKLRENYNKLLDEVQSVKTELVVQNRKIEATTPFLCSRNCADRLKATVQELTAKQITTTTDK